MVKAAFEKTQSIFTLKLNASRAMTKYFVFKIYYKSEPSARTPI